MKTKEQNYTPLQFIFKPMILEIKWNNFFNLDFHSVLLDAENFM